jgi:hypothetical protein
MNSTVPSDADPEFRLTAELRAHVAPEFDCDALERLLQHVDPVTRAYLLDLFLLPEHRSVPPVPNQFTTLVGSTDERFNALLAEVWQPFWLDKPDEMLDDPDSRYPGRELARERRRRVDDGCHG